MQPPDRRRYRSRLMAGSLVWLGLLATGGATAAPALSPPDPGIDALLQRANDVLLSIPLIVAALVVVVAVAAGAAVGAGAAATTLGEYCAKPLVDTTKDNLLFLAGSNNCSADA